MTASALEVKPIPILFSHRVQLSIPLSVLLFLAQFLKLFVGHDWHHVENLPFGPEHLDGCFGPTPINLVPDPDSWSLSRLKIRRKVSAIGQNQPIVHQHHSSGSILRIARLYSDFHCAYLQIWVKITTKLAQTAERITPLKASAMTC
jgi:hypothetical protein